MHRHTVLGTIAISACLTEVFIAPKPGLVDRIGPGAHKDMDFSTFLLSATALAPYWQEQALPGLEGIPPVNAMKTLRGTGILMDKAMFAATSGINTHKGLVFALSLLLYGAGRSLFLENRTDISVIVREASSAVRGCCERELSLLSISPPERALTSGERIFLEHGLTGIRGEAERGFPSVVMHGLPSLKKALSNGSSLHDSALYSLFNLMLHCEDTNIVARKGFLFWKDEYPGLVTPLFQLFPPYGQEELEHLKRADRYFSTHGISPGGAADLLTCTLFLHHCETVALQHCKHDNARV
ncbi:MAG TPA: triphosphoribosyl-dephospho-CoA synthase [Thermovirgaceae bacterium]|nr:triphosphoribosyl-dephospho-CoA synthase [Thermovirgaceae bacterium]